MAIFEFVGQFFLQNNLFKLQEDFSEHGIRVFLENLEVSRHFLFYRFQTEVLKRFQKQFRKQNSNPNKPRILWFS
jgi:hypothetical protein